MRIVMLAQFYPPAIGGEERHVKTLSTSLAARGHEVAVVTLWHAGMAEFELDEGVRIYRIRGTMQRLEMLFSENGRKFAPPFPDPELTLAIRKIIIKERPQIVHAHNWLVHSFLPLKAWSGAKLIMSLHDYSFICAQKRLMYRDWDLCSGPGFKKCLQCAATHYGPAKGTVTVLTNWASSLWERGAVDLFIAVSQAVAHSTGLVSSKLDYQVIPNFVPDNAGEVVDYDDNDPRLKELPQGDYLLFVGDLSADKGVNILLQAYAQLDTALPLVLIGKRTPTTPAELPDNVKLLESWPHSSVMQAWRRCLFGLLPSICPETFGIVVIEAMATGRPMIVSRIGGLPDIVVDDETGYLVPPGDVEALRQALARLLVDPALRERLGRAALQRVRRFQASRVIPRIEQVYQQLLQDEELRKKPVLSEPAMWEKVNVGKD